MLQSNKELQRFLRSSWCFSKIFSSYKRFVNLAEYVVSILTPQQRKILEIKWRGSTVDFKTQLLIYFDERYNFELKEKELHKRIHTAIDTYKFLFETNWDRDRIRVVLLREIMEVISFGTQCYYIWKRREKPKRGILCWENRIVDTLRLVIQNNYPNMPFVRWKRKLNLFHDKCFWDMYGFRREDTLEFSAIWFEEFFKRTKWCLERMNTCNKVFADKYREEYYQRACELLKRDKHHSHRISTAVVDMHTREYVNQYEFVSNPNVFIKEIVEAINECVGERNLRKSKQVDSQGIEWSFKEQLLDRYYPRYPSLASLEDIKDHIEKVVIQYQPLLKSQPDNTELILELIADDLDKELFICRATHEWNKEMITNLSSSTTFQITQGVTWAIDRVLALINYKKIKIEGKEYDLKTVLVARWQRAWLAQGKKHFRGKLLGLFVKTLHHPQHWKSEKISSIYLQTLLSEIDSCFLFPKEGRVTKLIFKWDDASASTKLTKLLFAWSNRNYVLWMMLELFTKCKEEISRNYLPDND